MIHVPLIFGLLVLLMLTIALLLGKFKGIVFNIFGFKCYLTHFKNPLLKTPTIKSSLH
jgi:hypothetical protein